MTAPDQAIAIRGGTATDRRQQERVRKRLRKLAVATDAKLLALGRDLVEADARTARADRGAEALLSASRERVAISRAMLAKLRA